MTSNSFISEEHQEDEEELKCPKCSSFFSSITKPYILPCNHNICLNCIDFLISENNNKCPICNYKFDKNRNLFKVNFGFLNLVIKILQTKIIYCNKCNKIFYWKEHYQSCKQKYFKNCNDILEDIKINCEESEKILKIFKKEGNILFKYKIEIGNLVKNILKEIHNKSERIIENKIRNELFKTNININFIKSKSEILEFLKQCLPFSEYFNTQEIIQIIRQKELNFTNPYFKNKKLINKTTFSPPSVHNFILSDKNVNKKYDTIVSYNNKKNNYSNYNTFNLNHKATNNKSTIFGDENYKNTISEEEEDDDDYIINNNYDDDEGIKGNDRIKVKIYHDNNISQFKKINTTQQLNTIQNRDININKNGIIKKNFLFKNQKQNPKLKITHEKKKTKFDINSLLDDEGINIEEEPTKNKIIVGLKDVKVISFKQTITQINNNSSNKPKQLNSKLIKSKYIMPGKKIDLENINSLINKRKINNYNRNNYSGMGKNIGNNNLSQAIKEEAPSLSLLRSTDYTKREYRFHMNPKSKIAKSKLNKSNGYNFNSNTINVDQSVDENLTKRKLMNTPKNINSNEFKIIKDFNKMKDITNKLNKYIELINFLFNNIDNEVKNNIYLLKNSIKKNYESLLNEIIYNLNHTQKNYLLTYINNTYNILLYDPFNRKYAIKNYSQIFTNNRININRFNISISIAYDDNDLIFISGGENNYNLFIITTWSTGEIMHKEYMPTKKAYHKTIFLNEKLYLIGGMTPDKKVSSECFSFNLKEKKWHLIPNLNKPRKNASLCFYNNSILYVFRGEDNNQVLDTIEFININIKKEWTLFKPIDFGFVWYPAKNSMILNVDKDKILICGGENNEGEIFKDCFLFEPSTNCIYKGLDLGIPSAFISEGCFYQDEIFGVDYTNETENNIRIIHSCNINKNIWKCNYIK